MSKATKSISKDGKEDLVCHLCLQDGKDELGLGKLYSHVNLNVHYYCLLFSCGLKQSGKHDHQGILGFMPKDITAEVRRGKRLRCCYCKLTGATLGCVFKRCPRSYHLPCGLKHNILLQFFGTFPSYCKDHRIFQDPIPWKENTVPCSICWENLVPRVSADTLYPPCCKNGWFHKTCVQEQAHKAGYFFRCPLCNNETIFNEEMEKFGVHIPEQDAAWESEPGAYSDMYEQHSTCDVETCICPHGREYDGVTESLWELILCKTCGSQGTHIGCSDLDISSPEWLCTNCLPTVDRLTNLKPPRSIQNSEGEEVPTRRVLRQRNVHHVLTHHDSNLCSEVKDKNSAGLSARSEHQVSQGELVCPRVQSPSPSGSMQEVVIAPSYRQRRSSSSSTSSLDDLASSSFKSSKAKHDSKPNSSEEEKEQHTSPTFSLKRPASFCASADLILNPHPVKKMYVSHNSGNPFACSSNANNKPDVMSSSTLAIPLPSESHRSSVNKDNNKALTKVALMAPIDPETVIILSDSDDHVEEIKVTQMKNVSGTSVSESNDSCLWENMASSSMTVSSIMSGDTCIIPGEDDYMRSILLRKSELSYRKNPLPSSSSSSTQEEITQHSSQFLHVPDEQPTTSSFEQYWLTDHYIIRPRSSSELTDDEMPILTPFYQQKQVTASPEYVITIDSDDD